MDFYEEAKKKLDEGMKVNLDRYGQAMKRSVHDALLDFCRQDAEFAQAVAQGGSFADCMKAVAKCVKGGSISDMEAWGAAVKFFFPGAGIHVEMRIDLCASVTGAAEDPSTPMPSAQDDKAGGKAGPVIDLSDFF